MTPAAWRRLCHRPTNRFYSFILFSAQRKKHNRRLWRESKQRNSQQAKLAAMEAVAKKEATAVQTPSPSVATDDDFGLAIFQQSLREY